MTPQSLTEEDIHTVRDFFTSGAAERLFTAMEHGIMTDWVNADNPVLREECWHRLQSILQLKFELRDAAAMKKLTERSVQGRRVYQA